MGRHNSKKGKNYGKTNGNKNTKKEEEMTTKQNKFLSESELIADAIVRAYETIENNKKKYEDEVEQRSKQEWQEITGQKKYPENEKWLVKRWHIVRNNVAEVWHFLFFKAKDAKDLKTTIGLMRLAVSLMFSACKWVLYYISVAMIVVSIVNGTNVVSNVVFSIAVWVIARAFRIASFEIDNNKDANLLISIFSGCLSFVAVIVAIIALFIE